MTLPTPAAPPPPAPVQYELLIQPLFTVRRRWPKPKFPVQNEPFQFGLRISNKGDRVFPGCTVRRIYIRDLGPQPLSSTIREEFGVQTLNPGQSAEVWTGAFTLPLEGAVWVGCSLQAQTPNIEITTYQVDPSTGAVSRYQQINEWGNAWFLQRQMEVQQERTNRLIMFLTLLLVLETLFGLKNMVLGLLHVIQDILLWVAGLIGKVFH